MKTRQDAVGSTSTHADRNAALSDYRAKTALQQIDKNKISCRHSSSTCRRACVLNVSGSDKRMETRIRITRSRQRRADAEAAAKIEWRRMHAACCESLQTRVWDESENAADVLIIQNGISRQTNDQRAQWWHRGCSNCVWQSLHYVTMEIQLRAKERDVFVLTTLHSTYRCDVRQIVRCTNPCGKIRPQHWKNVDVGQAERRLYDQQGQRFNELRSPTGSHD